jgi:putative tryptophan/tyrosine transport system substrate-binding protein
MRLIGLAVVLTLGLMLAPLAAEGQQAKKVPRIGVLTGPVDPGVEAFRQGLRELGYVESKSITIEHRSAEGKLDRLPDLAAELVRLKVDVIVGSGNLTITALKEATETIPIVIAIAADPVGNGFVASLARPGGNITGLTVIAEQLSRKRLELLKEINPRITRVAVTRSPITATHVVLWEETQAAAKALGIKVFPLDIRGPDDIENAFGTIAREHAEGLIVLPEPVSFTNRKRIVDLAAKSRLLAMYPWKEFADSGGLLVYSPNRDDLWRRSATYVDKILKGAKPADLPVEQPTKFELVINLKTAKALGLTIPQTLLLRADQVIE